MANDKDKIKELFSDKLKGFQPEVPTSLWTAIDESLSQSEVPVVPIAKKNFSLRTVMTIASIAAILLAVFVVADRFLQQSENIESEVAANILNAPQTDKIDTEHIEVETQQFAAAYQNTSVAEPRKSASTRLVVNAEEDSVESEGETEILVASKEDNSNTIVKENKRMTYEEAEQILKNQNNSLIEKNIEPVTVQKDKFSLALSSNSNFQKQSMARQGGVMTMRQDLDIYLTDASMFDGNNKYDIKHDQPVSFSLTVSKDIAKNISLETGLVYTYLSSTITSKDAFEMKEKQKFHYLGIPVNLNYTFFRHRRFSTYLTVGGMIEKDIKGSSSGNLHNKISMNAFSPSVVYQSISLTKSIKQSHPQFSLNSSLGMSYLVYKKLSVYGNVGLAYYIDASNDYRTIYSDRDMQLDLNLGFRWNF